MATKKKAQIPTGKEIAEVETQDLLTFVQDAMVIYGKTVNLERAVPDFRDGLKPVTRRIIHAANGVARSKTKSARVMGDLIGKYHPHGDAAGYGALSTLIDDAVFEIEGMGNWGNLVHPPAAMRYTECFVSKYGESFLDRSYYNNTVTTFVPNYDYKDTEPVVLPAQYPNLLFNGSYGVGVGISLSIPSFTPASVLQVMADICLRPKEVDKKSIAKTLQFFSPWGGVVSRTKANHQGMMDLLTTPESSIMWECPVTVDEVAKTITISNFVKGIKVESVHQAVKNIQINKVFVVTQIGDLTGAFGKVVYLRKSLSVADVNAVADKIRKIMRVRTRYAIYVTERLPLDKELGTYEVNFYQMSLLQLITRWIKWRIQLEVDSLKWRIGEINKAIATAKLMLWVLDNLDAIIRIIRTADNPKATLMSKFKLSDEQAEQILERKLRSLSKMEKTALDERIAKLESAKKQLEKLLANPRKTVGEFLENSIPRFKEFVNERGFKQFRLV